DVIVDVDATQRQRLGVTLAGCTTAGRWIVGSQRVGQDRRRDVVLPEIQAVVVPANADVEQQLRGHLPVVLEEQDVLVVFVVQGGNAKGPDQRAVGGLIRRGVNPVWAYGVRIGRALSLYLGTEGQCRVLEPGLDGVASREFDVVPGDRIREGNAFLG